MTGGALKIAVLDDHQGVARGLADWDGLGGEVTIFQDPIPADALAARLAGFEVVCVMRERTPFPADLIAQLPALRLLVTTGMRNLSIDVAAARARGIVVSGTEGRAVATSQHAMGVIFAALRGLPADVIAMRDGRWQGRLGRDLDGLTLGLVGLGRLGAQVAALARPFGMEVIAWSPNLTEARCAEVGGVRRAESLDALLAAADAVSLHVVLSEGTRGLLGAERLARMKPDAALVNTSRGPIVDWAAALEALRADRLGVYAVDVYDEEPLPPAHPIRDRGLIDDGRLILTPHGGYAVRQTFEIFYRQTVEAIAAWKAGAPIRELAHD